MWFLDDLFFPFSKENYFKIYLIVIATVIFKKMNQIQIFFSGAEINAKQCESFIRSLGVIMSQRASKGERISLIRRSSRLALKSMSNNQN